MTIVRLCPDVFCLLAKDSVLSALVLYLLTMIGVGDNAMHLVVEESASVADLRVTDKLCRTVTAGLPLRINLADVF